MKKKKKDKNTEDKSQELKENEDLKEALKKLMREYYRSSKNNDEENK